MQYSKAKGASYLEYALDHRMVCLALNNLILKTMITQELEQGLRNLGWGDEAIAVWKKDNARICQLVPLTEDEIRAQGREYNPSAWDERIDSLKKYRDVKFYKRDRADSPYEYDQYFAVYYLPEGLRLLNPVSYSGSLTSSPFVEVDITDDHILHYMRRDVRYRRDADARKQLSTMSQKYACIYTTNF